MSARKFRVQRARLGGRRGYIVCERITRPGIVTWTPVSGLHLTARAAVAWIRSSTVGDAVSTPASPTVTTPPPAYPRAHPND